MTPGRVVVRLQPGCSDGDPLHVPASGTHTQINPPTLYLEKIGQLWMEQCGSAQSGVHYILEALPTGYTMWQRPRPSDPKCFDKYLFGHPSHKKFDSPNRFFPHFGYLMNNGGNSIGCPCTVCRGPPRAMSNSSRPRSSASSSNVSASASFSSRPNSAHRVQATPVPPLVIISQPAAQGRPKKLSPGLDMTRTDQNGTPDIYRNLVEKLRSHKCIDQPIQEPLSPDWRAEQESIPKLLQTLRSQDQWIPRNGDIIMFIRHLADGVAVTRHDITNELCLYDEQTDEFLDVPRWEAGLVTEVAQTPTTDLLDSTKNSNGSCSDMRVELIPHPNNPDKSLSKRYKYISLRQSRPFFLWKELLHHVDQDLWHPSIKNALALTSTLSLVGKHRFRGTWPEATIYCHGIFVGSEMLAVGDTVRLLPTKSDQAVCTDIMSIKSIRLKWSNLDKASTNDYDEGRPFNSAIWLYGCAYTSYASRSDKRWVSDAPIPRAAQDYGDFYPLHPPDKELAIPYARVAGRLHERNAMAQLLGYDSDDIVTLSLDLGRRALIDARAFSRKDNERISQTADATWYWGDDRAEALGLRTINGLDVSRFNQEHDVKALRKQYRILDAANANEDESEDVEPSLDNAFGGRLQRFMAPTLPVRAAKPRESGHNKHDGKKRGRVVDLEDDFEDEIRQHTQVINRQVPSVKKTKVMVVID